jgi:beta-ring hydroxylase
MVLFAIGAALAAIAAYFLFMRKKSYSSENIPLVAGGLPFIGQVLVMMKGTPWDTMAKWVLTYGNTYKFLLFGEEAICIADPQLLKIVLQSKLNTFKKDTEWTYRPFLVLLGKGIVTSEGNEWLKQRTLLATHLKKDILTEVPDMALRAVQRLNEKLNAARNSGKAIEMSEEFRHLTLQVIAEAVLSLTPEESDSTFAKMYLPIVQEGNLRTWHPYREYLVFMPDWWKFQADVKKLNDYVEGLIKTRWNLKQKELADPPKSVRKTDILDKLLSIFTPTEWNDEVIEQVRDQIKTFILAGHETSASMLTWSFYELTRSEGSHYLDNILREASSVFASCRDSKGKINNVPSMDILSGLNYTECCLRESLRLYSVVPTVVRKTAEDVQLDEYFVSKGSTIMVNIQGMHHNPKYWPEPQRYKPERFQKEPAPYTFLPFVEGPRMCLGQYLSLLETKIVLSVLLSNYRFELVNPTEASKKHEYMIPIIPATGHYVKVYDR